MHVAFGNVLGSDRKMFKSRAGEPVKLIDLLDEAIERATAASLEKNPDLPHASSRDRPRWSASARVKYADLSTDRIKDYVFDWDRMLSFEGNTAPYLQYAHARISSRSSAAPASTGRRRTRRRSTLGETQERALALHLLQFDAAVHGHARAATARTGCAPTCSSWPSTFTAFYEACPVVKAATSRRAAAGWRCAT